VLKIATAADFCGTRWQNNAVIIPTPMGSNRAYLQPVARVMQLYRRHIGSHATKVLGAPDGLDVVASRREGKVYLHVANTQRTRSVIASIQIAGRGPASGQVFEIAADPAVEVSYLNASDVMKITAKTFPAHGAWEFPAASVSALQLAIESD
jgi:alpha-N-arabinofuranosidase